MPGVRAMKRHPNRRSSRYRIRNLRSESSARGELLGIDEGGVGQCEPCDERGQERMCVTVDHGRSSAAQEPGEPPEAEDVPTRAELQPVGQAFRRQGVSDDSSPVQEAGASAATPMGVGIPRDGRDLSLDAADAAGPQELQGFAHSTDREAWRSETAVRVARLPPRAHSYA